MNTATGTNSWIFDITAQEFEARVVNSDVPVLIDFWAPWCGPCQQIAPMLDNLTERYAGKLLVAKVNVDEEQALAGAFGVRSIPMLVLFHGGQPVEQIIGLQPEQELVRLIEPYVSSDEPVAPVADNAALSDGDHEAAHQQLMEALAQDPENATIKIDLARTELALGQFESALTRLGELPDEEDRSEPVSKLRAEIALRRDAASDGEVPEAIQEALRTALDDDHASAIDELLALFSAGTKDERPEIRQHLFHLFDYLGSGDERVQQGRRKLTSLIY
ncbi:MAG: thioredoxin [Pseudomonadota bacterium]